MRLHEMAAAWLRRVPGNWQVLAWTPTPDGGAIVAYRPLTRLAPAAPYRTVDLHPDRWPLVLAVDGRPTIRRSKTPEAALAKHAALVRAAQTARRRDKRSGAHGRKR